MAEPPRIRAKLGRSDVTAGALLPGSALARGMVRGFKAQIDQSPAVKTLFRDNPNRALAAFGFSEDFRREIMSDSGLAARDSCWATCIKTCWCSACCCSVGTIVIG
jgi:hypothetical protein